MKVDFFICDDVREEANGKRILIGMYPGAIIVLEKDYTDIIRNKEDYPDGVGLEQLVVNFIISETTIVSNGIFKVSKPEDDFYFEQPIPDTEIHENSTHTIGFAGKPFMIKSFGVFNIDFLTDQGNFNFRIKVVARESFTMSS